ncbi:hypothetical protein AALP_AA2G257500 [Arabis alpina]|uniref:Uncharacterized protein n=1 Tax=Arabis alpina TaxID=50452 RepID=A0A087HJZ4_ARAAL|nr:hypothetical protein AALP_AA2G257500 [Arabis alpina]
MFLTGSLIIHKLKKHKAELPKQSNQRKKNEGELEDQGSKY